jgi:1-acyl-sn-glycerol-3-phosphate acyltransferase
MQPSFFSPTFFRACRELIRQSFGRLYRISVFGVEHLPPRGPVIICPKHQRWEDILVMALALPPELHYIAKVELFQQPFVRELLLRLGGVPVDRERPRATLSSFKLLLPLLQDQAYLVLFPEGTYVVGRVGEGKHRLIQLLLKLQSRDGLGLLPFVPVGISYQPRGLGYEVTVRLSPPLQAPSPKLALPLTCALMEQIEWLGGREWFEVDHQ